MSPGFFFQFTYTTLFLCFFDGIYTYFLIYRARNGPMNIGGEEPALLEKVFAGFLDLRVLFGAIIISILTASATSIFLRKRPIQNLYVLSTVITVIFTIIVVFSAIAFYLYYVQGELNIIRYLNFMSQEFIILSLIYFVLTLLFTSLTKKIAMNK